MIDELPMCKGCGEDHPPKDCPLKRMDEKWECPSCASLRAQLQTARAEGKEEAARIVKATRDGIDNHFNLKRTAIKGEDVRSMLDIIYDAIHDAAIAAPAPQKDEV